MWISNYGWRDEEGGGVMPLYEYKCVSCEATEIKIRAKVNRDDVLICEECGEKMTRLLSAPQHVDVIKFGKGG